MEAPMNAQIVYEVARAYVKTENVEEGEIWVNRLSTLAPTARETRTLQGMIQELKAKDS
jgi:hypothetical protein